MNKTKDITPNKTGAIYHPQGIFVTPSVKKLLNKVG
ncbi:Uncharacterised protein [Chlamydia trachomatis]|nr:Uncharacterised protein [Chlamydia trachomatis]